jgi:hypothetical protein
VASRNHSQWSKKTSGQENTFAGASLFALLFWVMPKSNKPDLEKLYSKNLFRIFGIVLEANS